MTKHDQCTSGAHFNKSDADEAVASAPNFPSGESRDEAEQVALSKYFESPDFSNRERIPEVIFRSGYRAGVASENKRLIDLAQTQAGYPDWSKGAGTVVALREENSRLKTLIENQGWIGVHPAVSAEKLKSQKLVAALEFYADKNNWERIEGHTKWASNLKFQDCALFNTGGGRARLALAAYTNNESGNEGK